MDLRGGRVPVRLRFFTIYINGIVMAAINITSILAGFAVYSIWEPSNQLGVQVPVAAALSTAAFLIWGVLVGILRWQYVYLRGKADLFMVYLASLTFSPIIFVPLHYVAKGYATSFSNITGMWTFQVPVNILVILLAARIPGFYTQSR
jgi:hypothetical protein